MRQGATRVSFTGDGKGERNRKRGSIKQLEGYLTLPGEENSPTNKRHNGREWQGRGASEPGLSYHRLGPGDP